jgi:hypothetical protein
MAQMKSETLISHPGASLRVETGVLYFAQEGRNRKA